MKDPIKMIESASADNEPTFTIRAKDKCSLFALAAYFTACTLFKVNEDHRHEIHEIYFDWLDWQRNHEDKVKLPD